MESATISAIDQYQIDDFKNGNPIQIRLVVEPKSESSYKKGNKLKIQLNENFYEAKIVSDPMLIAPKEKDGKEEVSVVIEKT